MSDHLHDAGEIIAKAIHETADPHGGWLKYTPAGDIAVKELITAGWVPPGEGSADERLQQTVLAQQDEARRAWENSYRIEAERDAAGAFRTRFLDAMFQLQQHLAAIREAAQVAHEPEPTYAAETVLGWLEKILNHADSAAKRAKTKSLKAKQAIP